MATWKSYRISDAITEIEDEKFVLPVIQRRLVWDEEKMTLLFDTLLKGDSFGGIMVIEEEKGTKPLFNYRPFSKNGHIIKSKEIQELTQKQLFVIDGQQRLQAFYIGLKGSLNGKSMYFDLYSDFNYFFEFQFANKESTLPKISKENDDRKIKEHFWHQANTLLNRLKETNDEDQVADEVIRAKNITDKIQQWHIKKNIKAFYKNIITAESLGISKVAINKTHDETENKQRIVELFRRLNDGGTKLSPFDLVASILKGFAWEMEGFLDEILSEYEGIGLTQDNLIKLIFLLQDNHKKEMTSIEAADAEFAIKNKDRIKATLKSLNDFLIHSKLNYYYKDGKQSFIPLFFIAYHLFHKKTSTEKLSKYFDNFDAGNKDFTKMKKWMFLSLLNGVFRSRGAGWIPYKTGIKKLLACIKDYKNKEFPFDELIKVYKKHPLIFSDTFNIETLEKLDKSFIFYILYDCNQTIRKQDIDHIMPRNILENKKIKDQKINSINNFQLLDSSTNRGLKNGKPFKDWLTNHVVDKQLYLERHLIPNNENVWTEDDFENFFLERGNLIIKKINEAV